MLNVMDDPNLDDMARKAKVMLAHVAPETLRKNPVARKTVSDTASTLLTDMEQWYK